VPENYKVDARNKNINIHKYLREKAVRLRPGESRLLALDWWNGNRSIFSDNNLSGMMLGIALKTRPEEMYRAIIESTAYYSRMIIENFTSDGIPVDTLYASGSIAQKDPMMMQIYADVTNREIRISGSSQASALGSAMYAALAAGKENGGFASINDAVEVMSKIKDIIYTPIPENVALYEKLYQEYKKLYDYFGQGGNDVMKRLKSLKTL
jgi:L-ribulokinase